jgi:hypothetical protein
MYSVILAHQAQYKHSISSGGSEREPRIDRGKEGARQHIPELQAKYRKPIQGIAEVGMLITQENKELNTISFRLDFNDYFSGASNKLIHAS